MSDVLSLTVMQTSDPVLLVINQSPNIMDLTWRFPDSTTIVASPLNTASLDENILLNIDGGLV